MGQAALEGPSPLKKAVAQFAGGGGNPGNPLAPPTFAGAMELLTEATVDPAAGLPAGIPIKFTGVAQRFAFVNLGSVAGLVAGDDATPLRVVLSNQAAKLGLGYRVAGGVLTFDAGPAAGTATTVTPDMAQRTLDDEKRNAIIRAKLDQPATLRFPDKVSIAELLDRVKQITRGAPDEKPIAIYLDPTCFEERPAVGGGTNPAMDANRKAITSELDDIPLRTSLRLALRQVDLGYTIGGGLLIIGRPEEIGTLFPPNGFAGQTGMGGMGGGGMGGGFR